MSIINTSKQFDIVYYDGSTGFMNGIIDVEKSDMKTNRNLIVSDSEHSWEIDILSSIFKPDKNNMINNFSCGEIEAEKINVNTVVGLEEQIFNAVYPKGRYIFVEKKEDLPTYSYYDIDDKKYKTQKIDDLWKEVKAKSYIYAIDGSEGSDNKVISPDGTKFTLSHNHNYQNCDFTHAGGITDYINEVRSVTVNNQDINYEIPSVNFLVYKRI